MWKNNSTEAWLGIAILNSDYIRMLKDYYCNKYFALQTQIEKETVGNSEIIYPVVNYGSHKYDIIGLKLLLWHKKFLH